MDISFPVWAMPATACSVQNKLKRAISVSDVRQYAAELGFSAVYCFAPEKEDGAPSEVKTLVLLVRSYVPGGRMADRFYPASNAAYHAARKLAKRMETEHEVQACLLSNLRMKPMCRRHPAFGTGRNTLNYLPDVGSRFCLELLGLSALLRDERVEQYPGAQLPCDTCKRCELACPAGAITEEGFAKERCIRFHMMNGRVMPEVLRPWIGCEGGAKGILGCDICQRVCPANRPMEAMRQSTDALTLEELLQCNDQTLDAFAELYGRNYAIRNRILAQAVLAAANMERYDLLPFVEALLDSPSQTVAEHARWAIEKMKKRTKIY